MARTRTFAQLEEDVRIAADIQNKLARFPVAEVRRHINQAIQSHRGMVSEMGAQFYVEPVAVTYAAGSPNVTFPTNPNIAESYGLDVVVNGRARELYPAGSERRNDWGGVSGAASATRGVPVYFTARGSGVTVVPLPDAAYTGTAWVMLISPDLAIDGDTFNGVAGWEDWVVFDAAIRTLAKDGDPEQLAVLSAQRSDSEARIRERVRRYTRDGPHSRVDTRGRRRWREARSRAWW